MSYMKDLLLRQADEYVRKVLHKEPNETSEEEYLSAMEYVSTHSCNTCIHNCPLSEDNKYCKECAYDNGDGTFVVSYSKWETVDVNLIFLLKETKDELRNRR